MLGKVQIFSMVPYPKPCSIKKGPVYLLHCPMAFDNKGAGWLQLDDQTLNPYFGAQMLQCGGVEEVIGVKEIWKEKDN